MGWSLSGKICSSVGSLWATVPSGNNQLLWCEVLSGLQGEYPLWSAPLHGLQGNNLIHHAPLHEPQGAWEVLLRAPPPPLSSLGFCRIVSHIFLPSCLLLCHFCPFLICFRRGTTHMADGLFSLVVPWQRRLELAVSKPGHHLISPHRCDICRPLYYQNLATYIHYSLRFRHI